MTAQNKSCFRLAVVINNKITTALISMLVLSLILSNDATEIGVSADGQIVLGGVFPIHKQYDKKKQLCSNIDWQQIINAYAMIFAIETINEDPYLLPNITLGYDIHDGCGDEQVSVRETLDILFQFTKRKSCEKNGHRQCSFSSCSAPNEFSTTTSAITQAVSNKLAGIIGTQTARGSIDMQGICKVFNLVQITYGAKEGLLGDKTRFPTILRTIPPEDHYPAILESILSYFNWKFIAMLSYAGDLGSRAHEQARKYFQRKKICVLLAEKVSRLQNSIAAAVSKIKTSPAKVVIVMVTNQYLTSIIQEFEKQNVTGKIIITTGTLESQFFKTSRDIIGGMISISLKRRPSSKFVEYLRKFPLCLSLRPFLSQELENRGFTNFTEQDLEESCGQLLNKIGETKKDIYRNSFSISYVVDAVNALAHSIHKTLNCSNSSCQYEIVNHPSFKNQVKKNLYEISFEGASAPIFKFDANGNPSHIIYYIHNIKSTLQNTYDVVLVGTWRNNHFPPLHINDTLVSFGPYSNLSQISNPCSSTCQPGSYYQYLTNLTCCWKCISCPLGTVNNQSQSPSCFSCPLGSLANRQRTQCHLIEPYELTFYSIQNVIMLIYLSLGAACTVFTWIVIILYRHTAVVKASDFMLSQMFLLGILMCMSTAVSFAAPVSMLNCSVGFIWFCTSVVFIVSIIFVKTNRVSRVFESGFVKSFKTRVYLSYQGPAILVVFLTVMQIAICFIANYFDPIQVNRLVISEDIVYLQCRSNTRIGYAIAVGYFSVLCICCVYWAFKTRKLPENFCEAKYINFTSLIILMSLLTMVPSYFGTAGPIQAAISSFGIITLALAILLCMFSPKLYIILLHPEQNTRENIIADIANYSFNQVGTPITSRQKLVHVGRTTPAISIHQSEVLEMTPEISKERIN